MIQRCQLHKIRNVKDKLPEKLRTLVGRRMREAYHADSALAAEAKLTVLAAELGKKHPGAAASVREGMAETLTILHLDVPPTLARTLRSTNPIESMIGICRDHAANVKNWRDGQMARRWCAAGMLEAARQFRKVNGFMHLGKLRASLERHVAAETAGAGQAAGLSHEPARLARQLRTVGPGAAVVGGRPAGSKLVRTGQGAHLGLAAS